MVNRYIKSFDEFINEGLINEEIKWTKGTISKFENYYMIIKHEIPTYSWTRGEEVVVKHQSWPEPRTMEVTKTTPKPELKSGGIVIDLSLGLSKYEFIIPANRIPELEKATKKTITRSRKRGLTKREYTRMLKDAVSGHTHADYSIIYDLAENVLTHFDYWDLVDYMSKHVDEWFNWNNKRNLIDQIVNDMEQYLK